MRDFLFLFLNAVSDVDINVKGSSTKRQRDTHVARLLSSAPLSQLVNSKPMGSNIFYHLLPTSASCHHWPLGCENYSKGVPLSV